MPAIPGFAANSRNHSLQKAGVSLDLPEYGWTLPTGREGEESVARSVMVGLVRSLLKHVPQVG